MGRARAEGDKRSKPARLDRDGAGDRPVEETGAAELPRTDAVDSLGPAVTPEFQEVRGLESYAKGRGRSGPSSFGAPAPGAPAPQAPASPAVKVDFNALVLGILKTLDAATSAVLGVPTEDEKDLKAPADAIAPWVAVHAADSQSETMLRILALSGLVGFLGTKLIRYAQKPKPKKPRPDVATASEDALDREAADLQVMP